MPQRTGLARADHMREDERPSLFLDKEGRWFHEGVEITHLRTRLLFSRSIRRNPSGRYFVHVGPESAEVVVEDAPYTVKSVTTDEDRRGLTKGYTLHLNDGTKEFLASGSVRMSDENVMYCRVKGGAERARFLRAAYYQICAKLEYDERGDRYWLPCSGGSITIQHDG